MKKLVLNLFVCFATLPLLAAAEPAWLTDLPKAQTKAKAESKIVLVNFTGSDWCGWCIKLKNEIFSKPDFLKWAKDNAVLVEIDFPKKKKLSAELQKANDALAAKYGIQGFPTVLVLNSEGRNLGTLGYTEGGPKAFIAQVSKLAPKGAQTKAPADLPVQARSRDGGEPKDEAAPKPGPADKPVGGAAKVSDLKLKGISGSASRRFVLINNQTLTVGEEIRFKFATGQTKVKVLEIKENSVVVSLNGSPEKVELTLTGKEE